MPPLKGSFSSGTGCGACPGREHEEGERGLSLGRATLLNRLSCGFFASCCGNPRQLEYLVGRGRGGCEAADPGVFPLPPPATASETHHSPELTGSERRVSVARVCGPGRMAGRKVSTVGFRGFSPSPSPSSPGYSETSKGWRDRSLCSATSGLLPHWETPHVSLPGGRGEACTNSPPHCAALGLLPPPHVSSSQHSMNCDACLCGPLLLVPRCWPAGHSCAVVGQ